MTQTEIIQLGVQRCYELSNCHGINWYPISFIEVYGNATPAAAATGPKYQHNVTHAEEAFRLFLDKRRKEKG